MTAFLDEFYNLLPADQVGLYREMADEAARLGFKPTREKTKHLSISFFSNKHRVAILRFAYDRKRPEFRLKFFASKTYSPVFDLSIKRVLEQYHFKYTGCYGCGRCDGKEEGYQVRYEDGREYFRCGSELIEIADLNEQIKGEVIELLRVQAAYYENKPKA